MLSFRFDENANESAGGGGDMGGDVPAGAESNVPPTAPAPRVPAPMIDCTKRTCFALDALPPTLVIHLKRFYLDYNTFETEKYNNRFEFNRSLNVFPYTVEGVEWTEAQATKRGGGAPREGAASEGEEGGGGGAPSSPAPPLSEALQLLREACEYELQGVVVHTGTTRVLLPLHFK